MTIQDLGALGELIGSVAVLATLIYLTLQTRQNTRAIGAQADAARIGALLNVHLTAATSAELQEVLSEDRTDAPAPLCIWTRRDAYWQAVMIFIQWQFTQGRRGLLPSFNEPGNLVVVRALFATFRSFEGWWEGTKSVYFPEFVEWVEEERAKAA